MTLSIGVFFGIVTMLSWGVGDFFVARAVRKSRIFLTFFWSQIVSLLFTLLIAVAFLPFPKISLMDLTWVIVLSFLGVAGIISFYRGIKFSAISIVSPIAASSSIIAVLIGVFFLNESLRNMQYFGISLTILGAILVSLRFQSLKGIKIKTLSSGVKYGIFTMFAFGISYVLFDVLISSLGWFYPVLLTRIGMVIIAGIYSVAAKKKLDYPHSTKYLVLAVGILEAIAFLSIGLGISGDHTAIIAPVASAFPAITIILARIFFKEMMELNQKLGVIAVLSGLILLAI
jgi:drug/metabolite transporter (DMT)-like permease